MFGQNSFVNKQTNHIHTTLKKLLLPGVGSRANWISIVFKKKSYIKESLYRNTMKYCGRCLVYLTRKA